MSISKNSAGFFAAFAFWIAAASSLVGETPVNANHRRLAVADLRCEYRTDPMAVDTVRPRLSWVLASPARGARQSAYQILVASSPQKLAADQGDRWDSGKVSSDEATQIEYAGAPLATRRQRGNGHVRLADAGGQLRFLCGQLTGMRMVIRQENACGFG